MFAALGWQLFATAWLRGDPVSVSLLSVLVGFATMAGAHDMLYQRSMWLLAGALVALPFARSTTGEPRTSPALDPQPAAMADGSPVK